MDETDGLSTGGGWGTSDTRQALAEFIRSTASWRRAKAEEYDRDARNLRSAAGLEDLAHHVLGLPPDDPRLARMREIAFVDGGFLPGQQTLYELGRFRFHHAEGQVDAFLDRLVELADADRRELGRFGGRLPPGDDPWADDEEEW